MPSKLECPDTADELYWARGSDVSATRPMLTGDVFRGLAIPGIESPATYAAVMTHPCSMRRGSQLVARMLVASVRTYSSMSADPRPSQWAGHGRVMPLPDLTEDGSHYAIFFEELGQVATSDLLERQNSAGRVACLSPLGINLLQQRFANYLTRWVIPTVELNEVSEPVLVEAELLEEWTTEAVDAGIDGNLASEAFERFIRNDHVSGRPRQELLKDRQSRSTIRKEMRSALRQYIESDGRPR